MRLNAQAGVAVPASAILYEAVQFALTVAEETGGAFDPTVGHRMEARGFNREHRHRKDRPQRDRRPMTMSATATSNSIRSEEPSPCAAL